MWKGDKEEEEEAHQSKEDQKGKNEAEKVEMVKNGLLSHVLLSTFPGVLGTMPASFCSS